MIIILAIIALDLLITLVIILSKTLMKTGSKKLRKNLKDCDELINRISTLIINRESLIAFFKTHDSPISHDKIIECEMAILDLLHEEAFLRERKQAIEDVLNYWRL